MAHADALLIAGTPAFFLNADMLTDLSFDGLRAGHHIRSRIEAKMQCIKSVDERITFRDPDRHTAEIHICIARIDIVIKGGG